MFHQHSLSIDFKQYRDRQFLFAMSLNTRAGQQMLIRVKSAAASIPANEMPDQLSVTMLSEQVIEIKDLGLRVFD